MKSKHPQSWLFILISVCWLLMINQAAQAAPELTIGNYQLVSSKRITRTVFEYTYKASVTNTGNDAVGVSATVSLNSPGVTVLDNQLEFGNVSSEASSTSSDTFSIRQDRAYTFDPNTLVWNIQYQQAQPEVTWNTPTLDIEVLNGTVVVKSVSFKVSQTITNPAFQIETINGVSPIDLASIIEAQLSKASTITGSDEVQLGIVFDVATDIPEGEYLGALHVLDGTRTVEQPLPIRLSVTRGSNDVIPNGVALPTAERITIDTDSRRGYVIDEAQVTLHRGANLPQFLELVSNLGGVILGGVPELGLYQVRFSAVIGEPGLLNDLIHQLNNHSSVKAAVRAWKLDLNMAPNDPAYASNWDEQAPGGRNAPFEYIRLQSAWNVVYGSAGEVPDIAIGVVDTAFDLDHVDLIDRVNAKLSQTLINPPPLLPDTNYDPDTDRALAHGTLVTGVIGASANNGVGVTGVLWNANLRLLSTFAPLSDDGSVEINTDNYGMAWPVEKMLKAVRDGAKVINYSAGLTVPPGTDMNVENSAYEALINEVCSEIPLDADGNLPPCARNVLFVFGASNKTDVSADFQHMSPASLSLSYDNVISVTRIEAQNYPVNKPFDPHVEPQLESETDYLPKLELLAQGGDVNVAAPGFVYTTAPGDQYLRAAGTSFATPIVSGLAGLILTKNPTLSPAEVRKVIIEGACRGGNRVSNSISGKPDIKVIDAYESVLLADNPNDLTCQPLTPLSNFQFTDSNLADCINSQNWQYVEQATNLSCSGKTITNLAGIENLKSLRILDLSNNNITDLSALMGLTQLEELNLSGNTGLRCIDLDELAASLPSTTITRPENCIQANSNFLWPVTNPQRTQSYSILNTDFNQYHSGFDLISSSGDLKVYAAAAGKVRIIPNGTYNNDNHYMGNVIVIDHNNGQGPFTLYAHLDSISVTDGADVKASDPIGVMGKTGCELFASPCGVHLHFEVKQWGVMGNLDDNLGPVWGYTQTFPNLYGYLNPYPYLEQGFDKTFTPKVVRALADQVVRTGPSASDYTAVLGNVKLAQTFVATQQVGDWYEIDFPSNNGPAKGWIQAEVAGNVNQWNINDPTRGTVGVSVCQTAVACASSPSTRLSYLWDKQHIVELEQAPAQNGCTKPWIKTNLLEGGTGWVCGDFLTVENEAGCQKTNIINEGLVAYYPLDGHASDLSCNGKDATANGGTSYVPGVAGQAALFDGIDGYIDLPDKLLNGETYTVSLFVKIGDGNSRTDKPYRIFDGWTNGEIVALQYAENINLATNPNDPETYVGNSGLGNYLIGNFHPMYSETIAYGERHLFHKVDSTFKENWHHVVLSYDGNVAKYYLDGTLLHAYTFDSSVRTYPTYTTRTNSLAVLNYSLGASMRHMTFFSGGVDEVRIYNRALAESEILELGMPLNNAPTVKLNDTGITTCSNANSNGLACPVAGFPGQDAQFGRDIYAANNFILQKVGGGNGGFDFTKMDSNGNPLPASATAWDCVKDNVTGLIWEVKTTSGLRSMNNTYSWYEPDNTKNGGNAGLQNGGTCTASSCDTQGYVQAVNAQGLCGATDWRMPKRHELLSIVDNSQFKPAIDSNYFPNTPASASLVWSSSPHASVSSYAWSVYFGNGSVGNDVKTDGHLRVRLVRGGQ